MGQLQRKALQVAGSPSYHVGKAAGPTLEETATPSEAPAPAAVAAASNDKATPALGEPPTLRLGTGLVYSPCRAGHLP